MIHFYIELHNSSFYFNKICVFETLLTSVFF